MFLRVKITVNIKNIFIYKYIDQYKNNTITLDSLLVVSEWVVSASHKSQELQGLDVADNKLEMERNQSEMK